MSIQPLNNDAPHVYSTPEATRPATEGISAKRTTTSSTLRGSEESKAAASPSKESLRHSAQKINELINGLSSDLKFTVDDETGSNVVKVIDSRTKEVIRQIPAQEMLEIAKRLDELRGLLIKEQV